jgi:cyclase
MIGRAFHFFCLVLIAITQIASRANAQEFVTKQIGDDVLIITAQFTWWEVNMAALATSEGLVVVDTLYHPAAARKARRLISAWSDRPVRYVINTHHHADHTFGNGEFREALIIGHSRCPAGMESELARQLESCRRLIPDLDKRLRSLSLGNTAEADVLKEKLSYLRHIEGLSTEGFQLTPPALTLECGAELESGGKKILIMNLGSFHSDSDLMVYLPGSRLILMGDLYYRNNLPFINTALVGDPENLIAVYDKLISLGSQVEHYVPGHGPVADAALLTRHRDYQKELIRSVKTAKEEGLSLDQAKAQIALSGYRDFDNFEQIHAANIENCWGKANLAPSRAHDREQTKRGFRRL